MASGLPRCGCQTGGASLSGTTALSCRYPSFAGTTRLCLQVIPLGPVVSVTSGVALQAEEHCTNAMSYVAKGIKLDESSGPKRRALVPEMGKSALGKRQRVEGRSCIPDRAKLMRGTLYAQPPTLSPDPPASNRSSSLLSVDRPVCCSPPARLWHPKAMNPPGSFNSLSSSRSPGTASPPGRTDPCNRSLRPLRTNAPDSDSPRPMSASSQQEDLGDGMVAVTPPESSTEGCRSPSPPVWVGALHRLQQERDKGAHQDIPSMEAARSSRAGHDGPDRDPWMAGALRANHFGPETSIRHMVGESPRAATYKLAIKGTRCACNPYRPQLLRGLLRFGGKWMQKGFEHQPQPASLPLVPLHRPSCRLRGFTSSQFQMCRMCSLDVKSLYAPSAALEDDGSDDMDNNDNDEDKEDGQEERPHDQRPEGNPAATLSAHLKAALPKGTASAPDRSEGSRIRRSKTAQKAKKPLGRPKTSTHRVCLECGVTETRQWRTGPAGLGTLCNACGVRWKKKVLSEGYGQRKGSAPTATAEDLLGLGRTIARIGSGSPAIIDRPQKSSRPGSARDESAMKTSSAATADAYNGEAKVVEMATNRGMRAAMAKEGMVMSKEDRSSLLSFWRFR